jgi:hypothetical protein
MSFRPSISSWASILVVSLNTIGCGGGSDASNNPDPVGPDPEPEITGLVISNASSYTLNGLFLRTCGAKPWSTELSDKTARSPNATATIELEPGCYDLVAATTDAASGVRHRHAPGLQVVDGNATRLTLATQEFQAPDSTQACAATHDPGQSAVYVVGESIIMDQMLNPQADTYMRQEFAYQQQFFGVPTAFYGLLDSQGPNAVANTGGFIAFGDLLFQLHGTEHGTAGVDASLAHEFGHRVQHATAWFGNDPDYLLDRTVLIAELEADAFAGYYMAHPSGENASSDVLGEMLNHFYSFGTNDFYWAEPSWHGTHYQRYASNFIGAQTVYEYGTQLTYQQLHDLWMYSIINDILQNPNPALRRPVPVLSGTMKPAFDRLPHQKIRDIAQGKAKW